MKRISFCPKTAKNFLHTSPQSPHHAPHRAAPELRRAIYELVLGPPTQPIGLVRKKPNHPSTLNSLSAVNRKIHIEAARDFYSRNYFVLWASCCKLFAFFRTIGRPNCHLLKRLTIVMGSRTKSCFSCSQCELLQDCIALSSLRLHYVRSTLFECPSLYRGQSPLMQPRRGGTGLRGDAGLAGGSAQGGVFEGEAAVSLLRWVLEVLVGTGDGEALRLMGWL